MNRENLETAQQNCECERKKLEVIHRRQRELEEERRKQFFIYLDATKALREIEVEFRRIEHMKFMNEISNFINQEEVNI